MLSESLNSAKHLYLLHTKVNFNFSYNQEKVHAITMDWRQYEIVIFTSRFAQYLQLLQSIQEKQISLKTCYS